MISDAIKQVKLELSQYKYPYSHKAKLLASILLLLEFYDETPS